MLFFLLLSVIFLTLPLPDVGAYSKVDDASLICEDIIDEIGALCIYQVRNGLTTVSIFSGNELKKQKSIRMEGYVSGVTLLSINSIEASVDGQPLGKLQPGENGSHGLRQDLLAEAFRQAGWFDFDSDFMNRFAGKYAWFPSIPGDGVSKQNKFSIVLKRMGQSIEVPIFHAGSTQLSGFLSRPANASIINNFRYLGNKPEQFGFKDFDSRARAIADGIRTVEAAVGNELVTSVNLLDYFGPNNALTSEGSTEIWIYTDTFWNESAEELCVIAQHETLHILVDRLQLAKNSDLRELFADLRGFHDFSLERFAIITRGILPSSLIQADNVVSDHILFAFINEMNFLKGMKGGHSRDSLDEFCVSFLHTLLHPEELSRNLHSPVILPGGDSRKLSAKERLSLLEDYALVIEKFTNAVGGNPSQKILSAFLLERLEKTRLLYLKTVQATVLIQPGTSDF
ncbi:MAG: hypothetical protein R6U27_12005 [Desulfobacterales bacterium]